MAKAKIDVYKDWLKIDDTNRPLNYYQLMKLKPFEDDTALIRKRYKELNEYIRKFATGDYIEESQSLLNELVRAMLCLTDTDRKADYDFKLGRKDDSKEQQIGGRRSFEDILLENSILSPEQIKKSQMYADAVGVGLEMAIIQQKAAVPEVVMMAYAESQGLPFVNLEEVPVDAYYVPQIDPNMARQYSFIPVLSDMGKLILASPTPVNLDIASELEAMFRMPIRSAICTPAQINAAITKYYPRGAVQRFVGALSDNPDERNEQLEASGQLDNTIIPTKAKKKKSKYAPLSKKAKLNRLKMTVVFFNFTFLLFLFTQYMMNMRVPKWTTICIYAFLGASIAAVITWVVTSRELDDDNSEETNDEEENDSGEEEDE